MALEAVAVNPLLLCVKCEGRTLPDALAKMPGKSSCSAF